jgi:hypothetical protein
LEEMIHYFMRTIQELMASGKLTAEESEALEFALDLVTEEWMIELQKTSEHIEHLKKTGLMN